MAGEENECPDLDGWPPYSLAASGLRSLALDEFRALIAHGNADATPCTVETAPGGSVVAGTFQFNTGGVRATGAVFSKSSDRSTTSYRFCANPGVAASS